MASNKKADNSLKGTLVSTFGIGIVIILFWVICFGLFIDRF